MSTGKEAKAAFAKAATWGEPVLLTSAHALLFTTEKITRTREHLPEDSAGQAFVAEADQGLITCGGDLSAYLRFQGLEALLAMAMGQAGVPQLSGSQTYTHNLRLSDHTDGLFGTLGLYKGLSAHEYPGCKVDGFTITGQAGQPLEVTFNLICDDLNINDVSGVNTGASMAALAQPAPGNRVLMRQGKILLNDFGGAALTDSDAIAPSSFTLAFKRKLIGEHLAGGQDRISEPSSSGFAEITLNLEFPCYTSDVYLSDLGADTRKKMRLVFTGGQIEESYYYGLEILLPHLALTNVEAAVDKAGKIAHPITMNVLGAVSAPAGMTGITQPLAVNITNTRDSDPLA